MKKIFITGGCGYVGSLMIKNFLDKYTIKNITVIAITHSTKYLGRFDKIV
jgi:nucleoside-diphosphate-sugar epimerase